MTTPAWSAPVNGMPGDLNANLSPGHLNQFLGAHAFQPIYDGNRIIPANGGTQLTYLPMGDGTDFDQPITMSGTAIGRVQLPLMPVENGCDVLVQLYPDNGSGAPNTSGNPLSATLVPGPYINTVAAPFGLENATTPLQTERDNEYGFTGSVQTTSWLAPAADASGAINNSVICTTSDTVLFLGGQNGSGTPIANCSSATYNGFGALGQPVPQPFLPQATEEGGAAVVNDTTVVYVGGTSTSASAVTNVWAASWDSGAHAVGSWSAQAALPTPVQHQGVTSWGSTVYSVGGADASNNAVAFVYYSTVSNSQVGTWQTSQPLPTAIADAFVAAVQGWLFVLGGHTSFAGAGLSSVYYAKINTDGSLGVWQTGPSMPNAAYAFADGWGVFSTANAIVQISGRGSSVPDIQILSVTGNGPSNFWYISSWATFGDLPFMPVSIGAGQYAVFSPLALHSTVMTSILTPMPYISVPLPASGLTNGATYHIVMRAFAAGDATDGMQIATLDVNALPAVALTSPRYGNVWSPIPSGWSVPLRVYDAAATPGGPVRHMWQDPVNGMASSWSTLFYNAQLQLAGHAEVTMHPNGPLNSNPTFATTLTPWTATNGTITRSSAQTHGGFAFSGLLTPTGGVSQAYASSELFPCQQTTYGDAQWVQATGWLFSPTGWSNVSLSVNWFDSSKAYISTSSATVSLAANTWTQVSNFFQPPPTAAYAALVPTESGTPGATNLLYMSNVFLVLTPETVGALTSAATVNYAPGPYVSPIGVTQLL